MRKIDHIRKVVYIIVGILTIISLVFTLYKKIGKAASFDDSPIVFDSYPALYGGFIANSNAYSDSLYLKIIDDSITRYSYYQQYYPIVIVAITSDGGLSGFRSFVIDTDVNGKTNINLPPAINNTSYVNNIKYRVAYTYDSNGDYVSSFGSQSYTSFFTNRVTEYIQGTYYYKGGLVASYPLYIYHNEFLKFREVDSNIFKYLDSNDNIIIGGHSKGGVLANYQSSFDLLEDSSDVPKVDTTSPSDSSSVPAWLGKILNGLGVIGNSIQSGVLTIGDYIGTLGESIGEFFNSVGEKIDAIKDSIDSFFAWVTEPPNNETILSNIQPYLESNSMIQGFISSKNAIQGVYSDITGVNAKSSSQMKWTIPFNLPGLSNNFTATIDFGWYENIRNIVQPILIMIISVGFILSLIRSIPGILHGNSPEGDT